MKKIFAALLVLMLTLTGVACAQTADNSLQAILDKGSFVLGLDDSFPPMGFRDENNEIVGFDIDVAAAVCQKLGVELVLQPIAWDSKDLELNGGTIDCIWNGLSIDEDRKAAMAMSFPYLANAMAVYVKADAGIAAEADLAGKKVAVQNGSAAQTIMETTFAELTASLDELLGFDDYLTALTDLQQGGCDAVVMDKVVGDYIITTMGASDLTEAFGLTEEFYGVGFRKDDVALRDKVEEVLTELKADGTLAEISTKWFGSDKTVVEAK